jgi:glycosyltransferase involved in cell wall biosynthesis
VIAHSGVLASYRRRWDAIAALGHEVTLLTPKTWTEGNRQVPLEESPGSPVHLIAQQPLGSFWPSPRTRNLGHFYPGLRDLLLQAQPNVLEVFEEPYSLCAWHALRTACAVVPDTLRLVFSAQNILKRFPPPFSIFERRVLQQADAALPVDPLVVPVLQAKGYRGPTPVVPLGIEEDFFSPSPPDLELLPPSARKGPVIGFFGKLQPEKGVLDLVTAVEAARGKPHLVLAGSGPLEEELRQQEARLPGHLHLLGPLPQSKIPGLLATMDLVCVPSRTTTFWKEQFGRAAIEAMGCERPTLVSDSGSLPHVVGEGARVLPEANPVAWTQAFDDLLEDPAARRSLGRAGRQHVLHNYTWNSIARVHEQAWESARQMRS